VVERVASSLARELAVAATKHRSGKQWTTAKVRERTAQALLLRDILGDRSRPVAVDPAWLLWQDGTVPRLAQAAYRERILPSGELDRQRLAVLADALEEAGCGEAQVLAHLRGPGGHVRGCWVIDLLTGRA
jgi:hypothetical protein